MAPSTADAATQLVSSPFQLPASPSHEEMLAKYFRALGDPIRLTILELVADSERSVGEIVAATGQSQPKISNHLACLRWCGFGRDPPRAPPRLLRARRCPRDALLRLARGLLEDNAEHVACCGVLEAEAR